MSDLFEARLRRYGVSFARPSRPFSWQRLADPALCYDLLLAAGFKDAALQTDQLGYYLAHVLEWWDIVWGSGFRGPVSQLAPDALDRFRLEHLTEIGRLETEHGIWLDISTILVRGNTQC